MIASTVADTRKNDRSDEIELEASVRMNRGRVFVIETTLAPRSVRD
jgi:hypothetical protein